MEQVNAPKKILFVYLTLPRKSRADAELDITELWNLVSTLGNAQVVDLIQQKGPEFDATYIGPGKVEEVAAYLETHDIDAIIFNGQLKPSQKFTLLKKFWNSKPNILIWDRIDLILGIFSRHAKTTEAKLQIKLAQMNSMGPRIFGMGMVLSRQGGGIGTRGIGETNTELMRRHWSREIKRTRDALTEAVSLRERQMRRRKNIGLRTVSLVGYTNAGKTSLFNTLTHKKQLVEDALFATLDSTVGELYIPEIQQKLLVSDTIGFIANLPPTLIDAFKSTLLESVHADIVLHVIDASDPLMNDKIRVVNEILDQLGIGQEKEIMVFNKTDAVIDLDKTSIKERVDKNPCVFVSALKKTEIDTLIESIVTLLTKNSSH